MRAALAAVVDAARTIKGLSRVCMYRMDFSKKQCGAAKVDYDAGGNEVARA